MSPILKPSSVELSAEYADAIRLALTIRLVEQRFLRLFGEGKLSGTVHTCIGQEFIGVAVGRAIEAQDAIFSNHRCHGHFLSYRRDIAGLIAEVMGKTTGICGGRGGSQHLHAGKFFSNGVQGGIAPVAAGYAFGQKIKKTDGVTVVFLGDGTLGEGVVYEALNIASKWELPVLFLCENNSYAQSTSQAQTLAGSIPARAEAFGIETVRSSTWEWRDLLASVADSVKAVRRSSRPRFHLVDTYRLMAHSKGDDNRPREIVEEYWQRDPLSILQKGQTDDPRLDQMIKEIEAEIDAAVGAAEAAPFGSVLPEQPGAEAASWVPAALPEERVVESVRKGLRGILASNPDAVLIGEDIEAEYGGAFKCTANLSNEFPGRVRNTPISEAAIVGLGNGLALAGCLPVVEIMFGDFLTLAADQWINHAAKFRWMYNDAVSVPLVVRTPMGGKRGYGPTHSQSIEKHFLGIPGTRVVCLHHRCSAERVYADIAEARDLPTLVIENKILYGARTSDTPPAGYDLVTTPGRLPSVRLMPQMKADVTILAIGGMSMDAEKAVETLFEDDEIIADLFLPVQLYPFDVAVLKESLAVTKRLVVVEEGQGFASLSAEIIAQVAERFSDLGVRCRRITGRPVPIPSARPLEAACLPNAGDIVMKVQELCRP